MLTTTYIIALLACSHDLDRCRAEDALPTVFANRGACIAALDDAMDDYVVDGPMMVAECQALTEENARLLVLKTEKHAALTR